MRYLLRLAICISCLPAAAAEMEGRLRLEVGQEYDTNAERIYGERRVDGLERFLVDSQGSLRFGAHDVEAAAQLGGKVFFQQRTEDMLALRIASTWSWSAGSRLRLGVEAGYCDTFMRLHDRDWRQLEGRAQITWKLSPWLFFELWAGGRWFVFKPDFYQQYQMEFSNSGPLAGARLKAFDGSQAGVQLFYETQGAFYAASAARLGEATVEWADYRRRDLIQHVGLGLFRRFRLHTGWQALLDVSWRVSAIDSNSYGSSVIRHRLRLTVALQLPWQVTVQLSGALQFASHPDGAYLEGNLYEPEADENENSLLARVRVGLWRGLGLFVQGSVFRNAFNAAELDVPAFARETIGVGLYYELEGKE